MDVGVRGIRNSSADEAAQLPPKRVLPFGTHFNNTSLHGHTNRLQHGVHLSLGAGGPYELGDAFSDRTNGRSYRGHSLIDLPRLPDSRTKQGAPPCRDQHSHVQWSELVKSVQESRDFATLFLRGVRSFCGLDAPDKLRFTALFTRFTRNCEGMFIYYRDGALDKALWDEVERMMTDYFAYPGVREWWTTRKHWLTDEFRFVVEAIIAKNPEQKLYATYNLNEPPGA